MKKWLFSLLLLSFIPLVNALDTPSKTIALAPGWNVVSTPANLLDLTFSNGWEWITFTTLKNWSWQSVAATVKNIKPLDGFLVFNANSSTVNLYLWYKYSQSPTEAVVQKTLDYWWNLLGITTTSNPFGNIWSSATMTMDLTENTTNKLSSEYEVNVDWSTIANPELGEAYFVYVNQKDKLYGWISSLGYTIVNDPVIVEPEDDPVIVEPDPEEPIAGEEVINPIVRAEETDWTITRYYMFEAHSWVVFFVNNIAINNPIDWDNFEIMNTPNRQVITEIWFGCISNTQTINDCETRILKSESPDAFKVWPDELKVFKLK